MMEPRCNPILDLRSSDLHPSAIMLPAPFGCPAIGGTSLVQRVDKEPDWNTAEQEKLQGNRGPSIGRPPG